MITTSKFTRDATDFAIRLQQKKLVLIDGEKLTELMMDFGVGVSRVASYTVQKIDPDYFGGSNRLTVVRGLEGARLLQSCSVITRDDPGYARAGVRQGLRAPTPGCLSWGPPGKWPRCDSL